MVDRDSEDSRVGGVIFSCWVWRSLIFMFYDREERVITVALFDFLIFIMGFLSLSLRFVSVSTTGWLKMLFLVSSKTDFPIKKECF